MNYRLLGCFLFLGACSGSSAVGVTTTEAAPTTQAATTTTEATTTTLSEVVLARQLIAAAKEEIEAVSIAWFTYDYDTSLGANGMRLHLLTGRLKQRMIDLQASREAAGEVQRATGSARLEVRDIRVDLQTGEASVDVCARGGAVLLDVETEEQLAADDGDSWEGEMFIVLVDGVWLAEDFYSDEKTGGNECVLAS